MWTVGQLKDVLAEYPDGNKVEFTAMGMLIEPVDKEKLKEEFIHGKKYLDD